MKAYGEYISTGFVGTRTQKPSCRCCNGSYAKVGRAAGKKNRLRGLKKSARQQNKSVAVSDLQEYYDSQYEYDGREEYSARQVVMEYNAGIASDFVYSLRNIAPEVSWADSEGSWNNMFEPRALSALPNKMKTYAPLTQQEWQDLIIEAYSNPRYYWY